MVENLGELVAQMKGRGWSGPKAYRLRDGHLESLWIQGSGGLAEWKRLNEHELFEKEVPAYD